jgi:predicted secreted Zn-dependent protease
VRLAACLLYAKIHKNRAENLLHLMLYFSFEEKGKKTVDKSLSA